MAGPPGKSLAMIYWPFTHVTITMCNGLNGGLQKTGPLRNYGCDLIGKQSLFRFNWVKDLGMRSFWMRVGPKSMTSSLTRLKGNRCAEKAMWSWRQRWEGCSHSQGSQKPSEAERGKGGAPSPLESVERAQPCLDLSLDFWLQNWEKISFCYIKLPGNEGTVLSGSCPFFSIIQSHSPTK